MTTSSGLGPAKGSVVAGVAVAAYGSVKRLAECFGGERSLELNMVLAKAEGSAWSKSPGEIDMGISFVSGSFSTCGGAF